MVDATYQTKVYTTDNGDRQVVASGGVIDIETGGDLKYNGDSLIDEIAALSGLDSGELGVLNGVTPGTVAASKAVVVDAHKDIGDFGNFDAVNIDAGSSGVAGTVDIFPATASKGKTLLTAADNSGNTTTEITTAAQAAERTYTVPDAGASSAFVMAKGAATILEASGIKIARGVSAVTGTETVATGLTAVIAIIATAQDDLDGDTLAGVSATVGNQSDAPVAGSVILKCWKVTTGGEAGNPTLIAANAAKNVNWIAIGT